ncbi:Epimerase domain-containing protein [Fusarium falciforme]|uniref:Epimerase domain-containing protein n=1 Tax=Fusarium falciforme TaxID=195108 RepID=UPI002300C1B0|nr:Epimerase domain-containing protein [Fusarium falciforme]WAO89105.1 Epimerase domain-containing protein [Fusarium falciforme]
MAQRKILVTGATGYVGGSVLTTLLKSGVALVQSSAVTALVRKKDQADILASQGIKASIFRDLDDSEHLRRVATEHDVVIHTASGFHLGSALALIEGLSQRKANKGGNVHYIHTSGTWNLAGPELTREASLTEFKEDNLLDHLRKLEEESPFSQRTTLLGVVTAAERQGVEAHILLPPDIYGQGTGLFNQHTPQLLDLVKNAIDVGYPEYIGNGLGGAGHVHIADLAELYKVMILRILQSEDIPSGKEGLFFTETGYHNWFDVAKLIGEVGISRGVLKSADPRSITVEEAAQRWEESTNGDQDITKLCFCMRNKTLPNRAYELGWKPEKTDHDWRAWIEEVFRMVE